MESAAASPEESKNPIVEQALAVLRMRANHRRNRREEKEFKLKCERLTEKWRNAIEADPEMKGVEFALKIGSEPVKIVYLGGDDDDDEVLTKQQLIRWAVEDIFLRMCPSAWNSEASKLREKCRQLARNVGKKVFPGEKALTNLFKLLGKESQSPAQYIQWLKEAWEYKYPPDKDDS